MYKILISSFLLSIFHALIPNHWMPIIAVGKAQNWSARYVLWSTILVGSAHVLSTILIGILIGWLGLSIARQWSWSMHYLAPSLLIALGGIYLINHIRNKSHHHHQASVSNATNRAILFSLALVMFFSPCIELEAYYFTAGMAGWGAILLVSLVYLLVTVCMMTLLVYVGWRGLRLIKVHWLEHHESFVTGIVLILVGLLAFKFF